MMTEIFSLLQTNTQPQISGQVSTGNNNNALTLGMFDALIAEYKFQAEAEQAQSYSQENETPQADLILTPPESSQPYLVPSPAFQRFIPEQSQVKINIQEFSPEENETNHAENEIPLRNVTQEKSTDWKSLFSDTRRDFTSVKKVIDDVREFDEGVFSPDEVPMTDEAVTVKPEQTQHEVTATQDKVTQLEQNLSLQDDTAPIITEAEIPESDESVRVDTVDIQAETEPQQRKLDAPKTNEAEIDTVDTQTDTKHAETPQREIDEPTEIETVVHENDNEIVTDEDDKDVETVTEGSDRKVLPKNEKPSKPQFISHEEAPAVTRPVEASSTDHENDSVATEVIVKSSPELEVQPVKAETVEESKIIDDEVEQEKNILTLPPDDFPDDSKKPERKINRQESSADVTASFAGIHAAIVETTSDTPKISRQERSERPQRVTTEKARTPSREMPQAVNVQAPVETETEKPFVPTRNISVQNENVSDDSVNTKTTQPSSFEEVSEKSTPKTSQSISPKTTTKTEAKQTESFSSFQAFFDGATRTRRTPSASRVNTQPLSLRTGTYEAGNIQTQGRTIRNGIVNTVRFIRADGVRKANIIVDPPALGRISVELTSGTGGVEASVKVASEQIRQIVQDQITQLRDNLLQQGVQVSEFTVDVQQDNSRSGQGQQEQNQRSMYDFTGSEDDEDTENFRIDLEEGLLYWVA